MTAPETRHLGNGQRETHLRDYWSVVWQGRWTIAAVFLVVVAAVGVRTFLQTEIYRATATIEVQPKAMALTPGQDISGLGAAGYGWFAEEKYHNTQVEIIRSRDVAERAFDELGLENLPQFGSLSDPVGVFRKMIQVDPRRETGLIEISMQGSNRHEITEWVNTVARVYVERNIAKAKENVRSAVATIEGQIDPLKADLAEAEDQRFSVLQETKIFDPEKQEEIIGQNLAKFNDELATTRIQIANLEALLTNIERVRESSGDPLTIAELSLDKDLQELYRQRVSVERQIESASVTQLPGHPAYQGKLEELGKINERIADRIGHLVGTFYNDYDLALRREKFLQAQIQEAEELSFRVGHATVAYDVVRSETEIKRRLYDLVAKTMEEVQLATELLTNNVSILDQALVPLHPIKPRKRFNLMMGAMAGLLLGIGTVFFLNYLDNTFRTPDEIERYLGLSVLATIPRVLDGDLKAHAVKESYQTLRTSVIFSSTQGERKTVLITSAGPQEGKSSTVARLAVVLAAAGDRVLVLDCDFRRPTQHNHLEISREMGLTNFLAAPGEPPDWHDFTKKVGTGELYAMTCGPIPPNPTELFGTARFRQLLVDARKEFDWVLIDSPPAASLADTTVLASVSDMVVLVVRYNHADRDLTARVAQQLRNVNATIAGVVLNDVDLERASQRDYYYAGYYYASDDSEASKKATGRRAEDRVETGVGA